MPGSNPPIYVLQTKVVYLTRDLAAASGDVATTGIGFRPITMLAVACVPAFPKSSWGFSDLFRDEHCLYIQATDYFQVSSTSLIRIGTTTASQNAVVKSYDPDGFTLTWTKILTPTGIVNICILCLR